MPSLKPLMGNACHGSFASQNTPPPHPLWTPKRLSRIPCGPQNASPFCLTTGCHVDHFQTNFVLGHMTPNFRDLYTLSRKIVQVHLAPPTSPLRSPLVHDFAYKFISKCKLISCGDAEDVCRKIQTLHHFCSHRSVFQVSGAYQDPLYYHTVMEVCEGGSCLTGADENCCESGGGVPFMWGHASGP